MQENGIVLTTDQQEAFRLDAELKTHAGRAAAEMIETGRCLCEIQERNLFEYLGAASLGEYAQKAVGFSERHAYNFIKIYKTYGEDGLKKFGSIGMSKLVEIAQLNEEDRKELLESGKAEEMSVRALKDEIRTLKGENDQLKIQFDEITENVGKQDSEIADLGQQLDAKKDEVAKLKKELEEAQRPVVASMTDEEKAEMRKAVEKELTAQSKEKIKKIEERNVKEQAALKDRLGLAAREAAKADEQIRTLTDSLKALQAENARLQTSAKPEPKPAPTGNKELILYCLQNVQNEWNKAIETMNSLPPEDAEKLRPKMATIAEKMKEAAEKQ